ncbi:MAG: T9SS type A sorting domain-containing protein [Bacteroidales bacterium]|nr:T9SS type A sorting domain-containing protein [Bacteroidales bacterium]
MRKLIYIWCFLFLSVLGYSQIPQAYYSSTEGLIGHELRAALHEIIKGHNVPSYNSLWTHFQTTDKKANGEVWDMYSDVPGGTPPYIYNFSVDQCGNYNAEGDCYNREHSWPKAWWGGSTGAPMYSDLFHLYPTDGYVNNRRGNEPFGEVGNASWTSMNGSKLGTSNYSGWTGVTVFEPIDEYKGDFARTYFYMTTRYYTEDASWPANYNSMVNKCEIKPKAMEMLLQWHEQDPVSQKEIDRNNKVYQIQNNRNPFIDHPEFAYAIWDSDYESIDQSFLKKVYMYPNPCDDYFKITGLQNIQNFSVEIIDFTGKTIYSKTQKTPINEISVSTETWTKGCYILKLMSDTEVLVKKLVKY